MDQEAGGVMDCKGAQLCHNSKMKYPEWAAFCAENKARLQALSPMMVKTWIKGIARPPITRVAAIAQVSGLVEAEIIARAGLGPGESAAAILNLRRVAKNRKTSDYVKRRYSTEPTYRSRAKETSKALKEDRAPDQRFIRIMRAAIADSPKLGKLRSPPKPWSLARIKYEISMMKAALTRCEAIVSRPWKPWHEDRCASKAIWKNRFPDNYKEWQLADWKCKTYRRRMERREIPGSFNVSDWYKRMRDFQYRCAYCGISRLDARSTGFDLEADHLVSLASAKRIPALMPFATNHISNLVPACKSCNSSKSDCWSLSWIISRGANVSPLIEKMIWRILSVAFNNTTLPETLWLVRRRIDRNARKLL